MSFLKGLWKGVKSVGGFVGKIFKSKKTAAIVNAAAVVVNSAQEPDYNTAVNMGLVAPTESKWYDIISGNAPLDLNKYVTLPSLSADKKQANILLLIGGGILAYLLLKK